MQTELKTNNSVTNSFIVQTERQADIVKKIKELNRWQEEQKKLLEAKQSKQRQMLGLEQRSVYQMLGIQNESEMSESENVPNDMQVEKLDTNDGELFQECEDENSEGSIKTSQLYVEDTDEVVLKESEMGSYRTLTSGYGTEFCEEMVQTKPKKPFLKRGEGLKQRFNIHPDELKLNNLPKYKYANAHPRLRMKPRNKLNKTNNFKGKPSYEVNPVIENSRSVEQIALCDAQEQRFQKLLIASKNTCSSTPDEKFSKNKTKQESTATENKIMSSRLNEAQESIVSKTTAPVTHVMAWSKILDPLEIKPLQVPRNCLQTLPQTEESIFELLEQKAKEGSFDLDSTCLKEFLTGKISEKENETDDHIPVQEHLKTKRLEPVIVLKNKQTPPSQNSNELEVEEEESQSNEDTESVDSDDTTHNTIETTNSSYPQRSRVKVRFSDSNETHEYEEQAETLLNDTSRLSAGTTGKEGEGDASNNELFAQFKQALFAALQSKADQHLSNDSILNTISDATLTPKDSVTLANNCEGNSIYPIACKELQEKMDMVKMRLTELEREIQNFKDNNILLMKAKQDHELQKSLYAQEHLEAMEGIKDEKIRMEIYLHDERVKLEEDKRKFELNTKMKNQGIIAKERKECERLREQVSQLEMQLKSKEANHTTAQARLRSQIRNLEREHSKLSDQIEDLKRENKRLENENLKIRREQNNKILLEINRNIAKLAPKEIQNSSYPMPEEGPPTLGASRTSSKSIDLPASTRNSVKVNKTTSTNCSNVKPTSKKKPTQQRYDELEIAAENQQKKLQQQINVINSDDEEDENDILREPEAILDTDNMPKMQQNKITNRAANKDQNHVPAPPPSSPRSRAGCNNTEMKREIVNDDGSKDIWYPNGNLKKISSDGMIIRMLYFNKDIKETNINEGTVKYYYAETNTWHTTYLDGLEILEFPNGQVEHRHKSGIVEVHYPNNSIKIVDPKDERKQEEWRFQDGTYLVQMRNGDKILSLPNGQKEIHNKLHKRREYPDGTVKIVYPDGSTETRYSNGRIRLKDKDGNLVMDTDMSK